jgi:hypothetical protein
VFFVAFVKESLSESWFKYVEETPCRRAIASVESIICGPMFAIVLRKNDAPLVELQAKDVGRELGVQSGVDFVVVVRVWGLLPRPHLCASSMVLSYNSIDSEGSVLGEFVESM